MHQVLVWVYSRDRALVREGVATVVREGAATVVREGAGFAMQLIVDTTNRPGACYPSLSQAEEAVIEALQMGKLIAYGLENGEGDLKEIPALLWADLKFWWDPDRAGPRDYFRLGVSRWVALRFKRKDILAIWPDPLDPPDDKAPAEEAPAPAIARFGESTIPATGALSERMMRDKPRTRRTMIRVAVEAARDKLLAKHRQEPGIDEVFRELQEDDSTRTIVDYTDDKLVWTDTKGKHHDIKRKSLANLLSNIRKTS